MSSSFLLGACRFISSHLLLRNVICIFERSGYSTARRSTKSKEHEPCIAFPRHRHFVTQYPSIRASFPSERPKKLPLEARIQDLRPPTEDESDVSDVEADEDGYTGTTCLSVRHEEELSEIEEGEYEDAVAEEAVGMLEDDDEEEVGRVMNEDEDEPGQMERGLAEREMRLAERESQRAREAFESGNKAFARQVCVLWLLGVSCLKYRKKSPVERICHVPPRPSQRSQPKRCGPHFPIS